MVRRIPVRVVSVEVCGIGVEYEVLDPRGQILEMCVTEIVLE